MVVKVVLHLIMVLEVLVLQLLLFDHIVQVLVNVEKDLMQVAVMLALEVGAFSVAEEQIQMAAAITTGRWWRL